MKRIITLLVFGVLLFGHGVFAANPYMHRKSDTLNQAGIKRITRNSTLAEPSGDRALDKTLNLYAWFEPEDASNVRADSAVVNDAESRTTVGSPGSGAFLEAIKIYSRSGNIAIKYATRLDGEDFGQEATGLYDTAEISGNTSGESQKINNLKIRLDGKAAQENNIFYKVYCDGTGWSEWAVNGAAVVADDRPVHIESLEIRILPAATPAPPANVNLEETPILSMRAHQAYSGWTPFIMGKDIQVDSEDNPRRLEAIELSTSNPNLKVNYQVLVPDVGWTDVVENSTKVGSTGQSRAIEAIRMSLSGDGADTSDLYYRVKVEEYGWLDWANDGLTAGTENQSLGIQAIQIRILPKGASAPGKIERPAVEASTRLEGEVLKQINTLRLQKGVGLLTEDPKLVEAAAKRSDEVYVSFSHTRPEGTAYQSVLNEVEYRKDGLAPALGEAIVKTSDPGRIYRSLIAQQTCLKIILTDYYQYFGLAYHGAPAESSVLLLSDTMSQ